MTERLTPAVTDPLAGAGAHAGSVPDVADAWFRFRRSGSSLLGAALCALVVLAALLAPLLAPYPQDAGPVVRFERRLQAPSIQHPFGTDEVGRDVLSRVLVGSRISLIIALAVVPIAALVGVPLGILAGMWDGWPSASILRVNEVFLAIPSIVLVLAVSTLLGPSLPVTILAISMAWWTWYTRLAYGETLSLREEQFVDAARTTGAGLARVAFGEILPNLTGVLTVKFTLDIGYAILLGASLGFLGLGVQPPAPEWGTMVAGGREFLPERWWLTFFPGLAIFLTVLGFNLLGDGLRDVLGTDS